MEVDDYAAYVLSDGALGSASPSNVQCRAQHVARNFNLAMVSLLTLQGEQSRYDHVLLQDEVGSWVTTGVFGVTFIDDPIETRPSRGAEVWMSGSGPVSDGVFGSAAMEVTAIHAIDTMVGNVLGTSSVNADGYWALCWNNNLGDRQRPQLIAVSSGGPRSKLTGRADQIWVPQAKKTTAAIIRVAI